jgi:hypothetical protein
MPTHNSTLNSSSHLFHSSPSGCKNGIVQGGLCVSHGAKRRSCRYPGCTKNSKCAGLCSKHGPPRKRCEHEGCTNVAVRAGKCKSHGAWTKSCEVDGCSKVSAINGMCKRHYIAVREASIRAPQIQMASAFQHFHPQAPQMLVAPQNALSQVIAENNLATEHKLSQMIAAQRRLPTSLNSVGLSSSQYASAYGGVMNQHHQHSIGYPSQLPTSSFPYNIGTQNYGTSGLQATNIGNNGSLQAPYPGNFQLSVSSSAAAASMLYHNAGNNNGN